MSERITGLYRLLVLFFFFFQAEDGIRDYKVTGVQTCALPICLFMTSFAIAGAVGGPIAGAIMNGMQGVGHLSSWQWLFILEGIPSVIAGFFVLLYLPEKPANARWLSPAEQRAVRSEEHTSELQSPCNLVCRLLLEK